MSMTFERVKAAAQKCVFLYINRHAHIYVYVDVDVDAHVLVYVQGHVDLM